LESFGKRGNRLGNGAARSNQRLFGPPVFIPTPSTTILWVKDAFEPLLPVGTTAARLERFSRFHDPAIQSTRRPPRFCLRQRYSRSFTARTCWIRLYANDGFLTGRHATQGRIQGAGRILGLAEEAIHEADGRLSDPNDVDALYARGWTRALKSTTLPWWSAATWRDSSWPRRPGTTRCGVLQLDPEYVGRQLVVARLTSTWWACRFPLQVPHRGLPGITGSKTRGWRC